MSICELPNPDDRPNQVNGIANANIKQLVNICTKNDPQLRPTMQGVIGILQSLA